MQTQIFKPLTEEKKCMVRKFFNEGIAPNWVSLGKLFIWYWRMRATERIEWAEEMIEMDIQKKQDDYKWKILGEMKRWAEEIKNSPNWRWDEKYEMANLKSWEWWRTLQLGFQYLDKENNLKWKNSVLIDEKQNPTFFKEMLDKYQPKPTLSYDKPF